LLRWLQLFLMNLAEYKYRKGGSNEPPFLYIKTL
jgi:hypothetical protein